MRTLFLSQKIFKITDHYPIKDEKGDIHYYVDQDFRFLGNTVHVSYVDGRNAFTLNREYTFFLHYYDVIFSDGKNMKINQKFKFFKNEVDLHSKDYNLEVKNINILTGLYHIKNGPTTVAELKMKIFSFNDKYRLTIYDEKYEEEAIAIAIAIDEIIDNRQKSN